MSATTAADDGAWSEDLDVSFFADASMTLPGKSEPGAGCGEWYPREFCDECGEPHFGESRCQNRGCPNCWRSWARNRAEKITRRLGAARHVAEAGVSKRAVHAVVSPPEGEIRSLSDVQSGFRDAYALAKEKGVRGGVAVFHGFRVREEAREVWAAETDGGDDGPKLWAWVREHERDWRWLTYWSPHWHILGLSEDFEADDPDEQDGWVARRIRSLESFQLHDSAGYEDMAGASMYLLSHATFESDTSKDCIRWFGELATTQFSPDEEVSEGALSVIERYAEEAVAPRGVEEEQEDEEGTTPEEPEPCDNCGSRSRSPIWDAGYALQDPGWCERIGREQQQKLKAAFEWAIGEALPPPGLQRPQSEEEAHEAFMSIL